MPNVVPEHVLVKVAVFEAKKVEQEMAKCKELRC
jgi:hypothetical protein